MRWLLLALACLLALLQYRLWFAEGSLAERQRLQAQVVESERENATLGERNAVLEREVADLKSGSGVVEQRAREQLGLVKEGEIFYRFIENDKPELPVRDEQ